MFLGAASGPSAGDTIGVALIAIGFALAFLLGRRGLIDRLVQRNERLARFGPERFQRAHRMVVRPLATANVILVGLVLGAFGVVVLVIGIYQAVT